MRAKVGLDGLAADEVLVRAVPGTLTSQGEIREPRRLEMRPVGTEGAFTVYAADAPADATRAGLYAARAAAHPALAHPFLPGLVKWG